MYITHTALDRSSARLRGVAAILGTVALLLSGAPVLAHAEHGHPARIHEGPCEELGAVAYRLNGVGGSVDLDNAPVATPTAVNPSGAYQIMVSETAVAAPLEIILAGDHAVMVYESDEEMDAIACGNVGGAMTGDALITGLAEAGVPGHLGFAIFTPDGEQTQISLIIGHALAPVSASGATPDHEHAEGEDAAHDDDDEHDEAEEDAHDDAATPAA
jgi:hypothetical protein